MAKLCPHCRVSLLDGECPECAWMPPTAGRRKSGGSFTAERPVTNPRCAHTYRSQQCWMHGVTHDPSGRWWCGFHRDPENMGAGERQDAHYARCTPVTVLVDRVLERHPEWQRTEGEGRTAYVARMRETYLRLRREFEARA